MKIIEPNSLALSLDAVNDAFFFDRSLSVSEKEQAAKWIAERQGMPGSYANMCAPTEYDFRKGVKVFTGEVIKTGAATAHILGEEASRALILLDVSNPDVQNALKRSSIGMNERLSGSERLGYRYGMYCCAMCSCALWRHLAIGGLNDGERRLAAGMKALKSHRDGKGRWRRFPFYYTLLALSEIDLAGAAAELRYACPSCERYLKRAGKKNVFDTRRRVLIERILAKS